MQLLGYAHGITVIIPSDISPDMFGTSLLHKASTCRPATDCLRMRKIIEQFSRKVSYWIEIFQKYPKIKWLYRQRIQIQSHTELYS